MTGAIILAAGASSRLGTPKQTLLYEGKTLLQHAAEAAQGAECNPVIIVLGAYADTVAAHFHYPSAVVVHNDNWEEGMGTSIVVGMNALLPADETLSAVIIMVCDQPYVDAPLLLRLIAQMKQTGKGIVASAYADTMGVPAIFDRKYFNTLLHLSGDEGAKKVVFAHQDDVASVPFDKGVVDIDTVEDVEEFREGVK